jgi:NADH-quinone oxidoreductase subunit C
MSDTTTADAEAQTPDEPTPRDERREALLATVTGALGDGVLGSHMVPGRELWVRVDRAAWVAAAELAKHELGCSFFDFLSGIDWMPSPWGRYEYSVLDLEGGVPRPDPAAEYTTGHAGGDTRFQVFTRLVNVRERHSLILKADLPEDDLRIASLVPLYGGANWHERECWEMFGIIFDGHPALRHLYLPGGFEGHPLRKDFPLLARLVKPWPGIVDVEPMPQEAQPEAEGNGEAQASSASGESEAGGDAAEAAPAHGESHSSEGGAGQDRGGDGAP